MKRRLIVAITGVTGAIYGVRLLDTLRRLGGIETHLLVYSSGWLNIQHELELENPLCTHWPMSSTTCATSARASRRVHSPPTAWSSAPCSMRTLASVAHGFSDNLIIRAADVVLKERRRLVLLVHETPLNLAHLRNMTAVTEMGGVIFPPVPAFYQKPDSIDAMVDHTVERVIDLFGLAQSVTRAWQGMRGGEAD